jgi:putative glycosyltransferase (TIGR04372 family)
MAVDRLNRKIPGGKMHQIPWRNDQEQDINCVLLRTRPHLGFTQEEEEAGRAGLREMGLPKEAPFVCFHARDLAYEVSLGTDIDEERLTPANSDIRSYLPAVDEMSRQGFFALRMGAVVEAPLASDNPMVIDYATKARTELLDLYLGAKCEFFIGSTTGILEIPMVFRRPVVHVNYCSLGDFFEIILAWQPHDLWIPKRFWLRDERKFMTIREVLTSVADGVFAGSYWRRETGIEVVDNTAEEITAVVTEMAARLNGTWQSTKEDEDLQRYFWSLYAPNGAIQAHPARIGADFLRTHPELLD